MSEGDYITLSSSVCFQVYSPSDAANTHKLSLVGNHNSSSSVPVGGTPGGDASPPVVIAEVTVTLRLLHDLKLTSGLSRLLSSHQPNILAATAASSVAPPPSSTTPQSSGSSFPLVGEALERMQRTVDVAMSTLSSSVGGTAVALNQARQASYRSIGMF